MKPAALVVTMGMDAIAPARMPRELQRAGFSVTLLAPRGSFASHTGFVDRLGLYPDRVSLHEWIFSLAAAVRAVKPVWILPGDEISLRTLMQLVLDPPRGLQPALRDELGAAIRQSLGNEAGWLGTIDKSRLFDVARRAGVRTAEGGGATSVDDAVALARQIGYPVIVRPAVGSAGEGTARCATESDVRAALAALARPDSWTPHDAPRAVVQRWIDGNVVVRASVAAKGMEIAGATRRRIATHPGPFGPASVVEFIGLPAVQAANRRLFAALDMHGFVGVQYMLEPGADEPLLIEVNRRMLPATHGCAMVGIDLAGALAAVGSERAWDGPADLPVGPGLRVALFPQEWYRDPDSSWLRTLASDAPWHDPALFAAMLALPFGASDQATQRPAVATAP